MSDRDIGLPSILDILLREALDGRYALIRLEETISGEVVITYEAGLIVRERLVARGEAAGLLPVIDLRTRFNDSRTSGALAFVGGDGGERSVRVESWPRRGMRGLRSVVLHFTGGAGLVETEA